MGAIAVFLAEGGEAQPDVARAMAAAAPHRGHVTEVVALGRCSMAILDPDENPDAVIGLADGVAVAAVGSVDNASELARELDIAAGTGENGVPPLPAILAAGYRRFGDDLPARLRGVFAVAISDGSAVLCFRDHLGFRPLFYRMDSRGFYAATEAKQVIAGAGVPREPDLDVVDRIFFSDLTDDTPAALKGAHRLPKSTALTVDASGMRRRRYWAPESLLETARIGDGEIKERFDSLMDAAVTRCLTGRDAVSLSGGIDSPAVAAFAAPRHLELSGRPLQAISVVYPRYPSVDESRYVTLLAEFFDIPLHTYEQTANVIADLDRWTMLADTPFHGAALAQYEEDFIRARSLGSRTVLTGEHAEFLIAFQWNVLDHYLTHGRFRAVRRELMARRARGRTWPSLMRLVARSVAPDRLLALSARLKGWRPPTVPAWVDLRTATSEEAVPPWQRWRVSQLSAFIGPGLSVEAEEVCQAVTGVRTRKPWTDVDLWEFFLSLPAEQKFPDLRSKGLVRELLRGRVPDVILDRTDKTVFDEASLAEVDYAALRGYLASSDHRVRGVDYGMLSELIRQQRLTTLDYMWARNLASIHAFLSQW